MKHVLYTLYISVLTDSVLELAKQSSERGHNAIRLAIKRKGSDMHMAYCRKIFGTYLRDNSIPTEVIDILQGRVSPSIFARHYYRPDFNEYSVKIRSLLQKLRNEITE